MVGGLLSRHQAVNTATCSSQTNRTPVFLPLLLDCLFSVEENNPRPHPHPILETKERKILPARQKWALCAYYFVAFCLRVVFLAVGPKQSNQIAFVSDASLCSHSAHTMGEFISLRQQGCQCNLWVCWSESRLRAVQLGMLMGFGWGTELSGCCSTSAEKLASSLLWLTTIWSFKAEVVICEVVFECHWCFNAVAFCTTLPRNHLLNQKSGWRTSFYLRFLVDDVSRLLIFG